jgi:hypothetical protein
MACDYEKLAKEAAGNWQKFDSFCWYGQPDEDADKWCLVYTSNRDSGLLDQSNAAQIEEMLKPFIARDTVRAETHSHWAVGHVDGYAILVYTKKGKVTKAFQKWCDIQEQLADYPVLNDEDYSERETEATEKNLTEAGQRVLNRHDVENPPEDWVHQAWEWFCEHKQSAIENTDDQGGYPDDEELLECFTALSWIEHCEKCGDSSPPHQHCAGCDAVIVDAVVDPVDDRQFCSMVCFADSERMVRS